MIYIENSNLCIVQVGPSLSAKVWYCTKKVLSRPMALFQWQRREWHEQAVISPQNLCGSSAACVHVCVRKRKGQAARGRNLLHYALIWVYVGRVQARIFSLGGPELGLNFVSRYLHRSAPNEFPGCATAHWFDYGHIKNTAFTCMV